MNIIAQSVKQMYLEPEYNNSFQGYGIDPNYFDYIKSHLETIENLYTLSFGVTTILFQIDPVLNKLLVSEIKVATMPFTTDIRKSIVKALSKIGFMSDAQMVDNIQDKIMNDSDFLLDQGAFRLLVTTNLPFNPAQMDQIISYQFPEPMTPISGFKTPKSKKSSSRIVTPSSSTSSMIPEPRTPLFSPVIQRQPQWSPLSPSAFQDPFQTIPFKTNKDSRFKNPSEIKRFIITVNDPKNPDKFYTNTLRDAEKIINSMYKLNLTPRTLWEFHNRRKSTHSKLYGYVTIDEYEKQNGIWTLVLKKNN